MTPEAEPTSPAQDIMVLMFTDIVGSVEIKTRLGNKVAAGMIEQHDRMFGEIVASIPGAEILKDLGDGYLARFHTSSDAVIAGLRFQDAIRRAQWSPEPVSVRVGIHIGEVEKAGLESSGRPKLVGLATDIAARVMSLALGGQILMTRTVFDDARMFVRQHPRPEEDGAAEGQLPVLEWMAHGPYLFAGYDETLDVFEVGAEGSAPLTQPGDTAKARQATPPGDEEALGWRPAVGLTVPDRPNWVIEEKLGEGGFGEVWLALQPKLKERRVFKFCIEPERLRGLKREVVLLRLIKESLGDRDDIVRILDWQFERPPFYLEFEHTAGGSLVDWVDRLGGIEKVDPKLRLELVRQVADALAAAHSVGIIHRDIKPANILIVEEPSGGARARLTDFGIGMVTNRELLDRRGITSAGLTQTIIGRQSTSPGGTPKYLAPELIEGKQATTLSDVYSLGIVLYQMVVGDLGRVLAVGWEREIEDELLREDIAACVEGVPERRLSSANELAARLRDLDRRRADLERERADELARRRSVKRRKFLTAAALVSLLILAVVSWSENRRAASERARAESEAVLRAEADESRRRADVEAETARQAVEFLVDLFQVSDPWAVSEEGTPRGATVTVREILDHGAARIKEELREQPQVQATLMYSIGRVYHRLGMPAEARELLEDSTAILGELYPQGSPEVAASLDILAEALRDLGRPEEAGAIVTEALEMRRRLFGDDHMEVARSLDLLGRLQRANQQYDAAERTHREEIAIMRALLEEDDPMISLAMLNLGLVRFFQKDVEEAESLMRRGLEIQRKARAEIHPDLARLLNGLAFVLKRKGDLAEAEALYLEAYEIQCELLPANHPTLKSLTDNLTALALEMLRKGDRTAMKRIQDRAAEIRTGASP